MSTLQLTKKSSLFPSATANSDIPGSITNPFQGSEAHSFPEEQQCVSADDNETDSDSSKEELKEKSSKKQKKLRKEKKKRKQDAGPLIEKTVLKKPKIDQQQVDWFCFDTQGDKGNLTYGKLYKMDIPKFRRMGGDILGLSNCYIASGTQGGGDEITIGLKENFGVKLERYMENVDLVLKLENSTRLLPDPEKSYFGDFVALDFEEGEEQSDSNNLQNDEWKQQVENFNQKLREDPENKQLWIDFIKFQDSLSKYSSSGIKRGLITEKKLAIYEKALESIPEDEELLLGYLQCMSQGQEVAKTLTKWEQILKSHPRALNLWMEYLNFRQTNFASFSVFSCLDSFSKCINTVANESSNEGVNDSIENFLLLVFLRACTFLRQAGYSEKAIACFQAMIELTWNCPKALVSIPFSKKIAQLEKFWENEYIRFGENDYKGWQQIVDEEEEEFGHCLDTTSDSSSLQDQDLFYKWGSFESKCDSENFLPARSITLSTVDESSLNPHHIVIFRDIRGLLFEIKKEETKTKLMYGFLQFLGFPVQIGTTSQDPANTDPFFHDEMCVDAIQTSLLGDKTLGLSSSASPFPFVTSTYTSKYFFNSNVYAFRAPKENIFLRNVLSQIQSLSPHITCLTDLMIGMELCKSEKRAERFSKQLLKNGRNDIKVWCSFGLLKKSSKKLDEASTVFHETIKCHRASPQHYLSQPFMLYKNYALIEIEKGNQNRAIEILTLFTEPQVPFDQVLSLSGNFNSGRLESARKFFSNIYIPTRYAFQNGAIEAEDLTDYIYCFALFQYLTVGWEAAESVYQRGLQDTIESSRDYLRCRELLHEDFSELMYQHTLISTSFKLKEVRELLIHSLEIFPCNSKLWNLFNLNEERTKVENNLRKQLDQVLAKEPNHFLWIFYIFTEIRRPQKNTNFVRSLFEKAIDSTSTSGSIALWSLYLGFLYSSNLTEEVKSYFYRAIQSCPWSKELYLLAFTKIRSSFTEQDLLEIINIMEDKEIHMRLDFETLEQI